MNDWFMRHFRLLLLLEFVVGCVVIYWKNGW